MENTKIEEAQVITNIDQDVLDETTRYKLLYLKTNSELLKAQISLVEFRMDALKREGEQIINRVNEIDSTIDTEMNEYCMLTFNKTAKEVLEEFNLNLNDGRFTKKTK
jgi:hypothetical protein